ncbi:hypothetical protein HGM15179_017787 [Zosterops borbonicus]|uniref:Uncharacterized protein n=1 Tax=Zosterops borbonicus TaxID=364589 RepID=A0A8K1G079_9PASS|nr:hypothetical protein HGM15179_017787 [Zosterops borbonicus]
MLGTPHPAHIWIPSGWNAAPEGRAGGWQESPILVWDDAPNSQSWIQESSISFWDDVQNSQIWIQDSPILDQDDASSSWSHDIPILPQEDSPSSYTQRHSVPTLDWDEDP